MKFSQGILFNAFVACSLFVDINADKTNNSTSCIKKEVTTELDFFNSVITENKLHEGGLLRYENIGIASDRKVDLVVSVVEGTTYENPKPGATGKGGKFGKIYLNTNEGDAKSGEGNFRFCFQDTETGDLATIGSFRWTIYDFDERTDSDDGIKEKMMMDVTQASSYSLWPDAQDSEVVIFCEDSGRTPPCQKDERTVFHSSTHGDLEDNPDDPLNLTEQQKKRSVVFTFENTSCWEFTYDHYCPMEPEGRCRTYNGGNFLFSGSSNEIIEEGECLTHNDNTIDLCLEDVTLQKKYGVTNYPIVDRNQLPAVEIVHQDSTSVDIALNQVWTDEDTTLDYIYYQYKDSWWSQKCYEAADTKGNSVYDTISLSCNIVSPIAFLKICIADDKSKGFLDIEEDNASIPKCCHSEVPDDTPIVCYNLQINCVTKCIENDNQVEGKRKLLRGY